MTSVVSLVNSYRYISFSQLKRKLAMTYKASTLRNLRAVVRKDLAQGYYLCKGTDKPRGNWILQSHQAKGKDYSHALLVSRELIDLELWANEQGYNFSFVLTPTIGKLIPDAEIILQIDSLYSLIYLELEYSGNRPKLEKYIQHQELIKERIKNFYGQGREPIDFHFHLRTVNA